MRRSACFDRFTVRMDLSDALDASAPGMDATEAVKAAMPRVKFIHNAVIGDPSIEDSIRAELAEYGAWDSTQLADDDENRLRIVWIAASNIREEEKQTA